MLIFLLSGPVLTASSLEEKTGQRSRLDWFREAKFGLFIHWGVYSQIGREEWARELLQIPWAEYQKYARSFNPVNYNPRDWVKLAREAGVKYIVITSKHHDGFCLFDSAFTENDSLGARIKRDLLGELVQACREENLPIGFYYSIMDWYHPDYLPRRSWEKDRPAGGADFKRYVRYMKSQLQELVLKYQPAILWFDGEWEHKNEDYEAIGIGRMLRQLKPDILINDRLFNRAPGLGDFGTPENYVPATGWRNEDGSLRLWEVCMTMNFNGWGYNHYETEFRNGPQLIRQLIEIASKGGNLLLNIGPRPDGTIQPEFVERLKQIGNWLRVNGEAIYGSEPSVFNKLPFFGRCTVKGNRLFIHVMGWPQDKKVVLPGLKNKVQKVYFLADRQKLNYSRKGNDLLVQLPDEPLDRVATVVVVDVEGQPQAEPYQIKPGAEGRLELPVYLAEIKSQMGQRAYLDYFYRTTLLTNWQNVNDFPEWEFELPRGGRFELLASYAWQWGGKSSFLVEIDDRELVRGQSEPSPSIYFPATHRLGQVELAAGKHVLRFKITSLANNNALKLEKVILQPAGR
ncbi:MAG: alpha-L-fucosidase [Candidatus Saccharicenans sp.]|nr:alpha-L-fucosidase [Candidatus Saccharicenans sp.]MDH7492714.1 alpha-L-fucosidase [Candidatus Saccharicenans sp.]